MRQALFYSIILHVILLVALVFFSVVTNIYSQNNDTKLSVKVRFSKSPTFRRSTLKSSKRTKKALNPVKSRLASSLKANTNGATLKKKLLLNQLATKLLGKKHVTKVKSKPINLQEETKVKVVDLSVLKPVDKKYLTIIASKLSSCWIVPSRYEDIKTTVQIHAVIGKNGVVQSAVILQSAKTKAKKIIAELAKTALLSSRCNPLSLPKDQYSQWKNISFRFIINP